MTNLFVHHKSGKEVSISLRPLALKDLPLMLALQAEILEELPNPSWYACASEEEFRQFFNEDTALLGYFTPEQELIAMGIYVKKGLHPHNYGYDLDMDDEELRLVGQIDSTIVHPNYRGNGLQKLLCEKLEEIALQKGTPILSATASPDNIYSVNTFLRLGYTIEKEKLKYGGLLRYILKKELKP